MKVSLQNRKPSYAATIAVEACLGNETLQENYRLRCTPPPAAKINRVVVRLGRRREVPVQWSLENDDEQALTARAWPVEEELAAGRPPEEETWELTLRRPRSKPFEIRAPARRNSPARRQSASPRCPTPRWSRRSW